MLRKNHLKIGNFLALLLGLAILFYVIREVSWSELLELFSLAGWLIMLPILVYPGMMVFHALDTQSLLPSSQTPKTPWPRLFLIRIVGDSINKITPFLDVGGEPLKIILLIRYGAVALHDAVIAVVISRVGFVLSEIIMILFAWLALHQFYPYPQMNLLILISIVMSLCYVGLMVAAQIKGAVKIIPRVSKALHINQHDHIWSEIDQSLKQYYKIHSTALAWNVVWQFMAWTFGLFEVYLFFQVLGSDISLLQAFVFQSILQSIKTVSFMIPGNIGAQEGGLGLLAVHFGFTLTDGFALSLIKRFRQVVWLIVGMIIWKVCFKKPLPKI